METIASTVACSSVYVSQLMPSNTPTAENAFTIAPVVGVGSVVTAVDGAAVADSLVGSALGSAVGSGVGLPSGYDGATVGSKVGSALGSAVGSGVGLPSGYVGASVGSKVISELGSAVGEIVLVGVAV